MAMWELRHPIDSAPIFKHPELTEALNSHASSFTAITALHTEVAPGWRRTEPVAAHPWTALHHRP